MEVDVILSGTQENSAPGPKKLFGIPSAANLYIEFEQDNSGTPCASYWPCIFLICCFTPDTAKFKVQYSRFGGLI